MEDIGRKPTAGKLRNEMRKKREAERLASTSERLRQQIEQVSMALTEPDAALAERDVALAAERALKTSTERAARKSLEAKAMLQDHLIRTWVDLESRLEQTKLDLRVEQWEVGLRNEHEVFLTALDGLPFAERE